jgi:hypothetical protein
MAVHTQQLEVLEPVVQRITVHVVERERGWPSTPGRQAASLTTRRLEAFADQPTAHVVPRSACTRDKQLLYRQPRGSAPDGASTHCRIPRLVRETETQAALANRAPLVVEPLDLGPVITASATRVDWPPEPPSVVGDRRLRDAQSARYVAPCDAGGEKFSNLLARAMGLGRQTRIFVPTLDGAGLYSASPNGL